MKLAGPAAAAELARLHAAAFPPEEAWDTASIAAALAMPGCFAVIEPGEGMAIGRVAADEAEVLTLAVAPGKRRQGLGARLMAGLWGAAQGLGATRLFLEVSETNEAARRLYARLGFVAVGRRDRYYADGSAALVLRLS
jgi:ribosomal-protein-alanine N-acetyltransferase